MFITLPFVVLFVRLLLEDFICTNTKPEYADMHSCETALTLIVFPVSFHHMFHILFSTSSFVFFSASLFLVLYLSLLLYNSECIEQHDNSCETSFNWNLVLSHAHKSLVGFIAPAMIFCQFLQ